MSPEAPKAKSFADILQQNQEFIAHLQTLQDDMGGQLTQNARELELVKQQLEAKQQELDELQNAQLQWAMDRQALLEQHESLKKGHANLQQTHDRGQLDLGRVKDELAGAKARDDEHARERQALLDQHESLKQGHLDLQQSHDRAQVELARFKDDVARAKTRDEERRGQLRQLEQERIQLAQKYEGDQKKLRTDLKTAEDDLNNLQTAQLQWAVDRETLLKDRDTAVAKQAQLEQEWQKSRVELTQEKARLQSLTSQLQEQLKAVQGEVEPLKAAREKWQAERQRLIADVARLEQGAQAAEGQYKADRKLLQTQLEEARKKGADLDKAEAEFQRLSDERSALLTKVKALEKDWQSREASFAEEKATLRKQAAESSARLAATQRDYEKIKALHADLA
ncbi:MAG: hypothetical protein E6I43_07600, partial [Chloroflexi bacterium]